MPNSPLALPLALWASTTVLPAQNAPGLDPRMAQIAAAYAAKVAASALFVSERTLQSVLAEELAPDQPLQAAMRSQLRLDVDRERGAVTAVLGKATATAIRTNGLGCVLLPAGAPATELRARGTTADLPKLPAAQWPRGDRLPAPDELEDIDRTALAAALDAAFREPERGPLVRTRAIDPRRRGAALPFPYPVDRVNCRARRSPCHHLGAIAGLARPGDPRSDVRPSSATHLPQPACCQWTPASPSSPAC